MRRRKSSTVIALAATLAACTPTTQAAQTVATATSAPATAPPPVQPLAVASARPGIVTPSPLASPTGSPSSPVAIPSPTATATPVHFVAPDAPPEILGFSISAVVVHPGDVLSGNVTASSNVASVEVRVAGYSYNMVKTEPGRFTLAVTIPNVPKMFRRTYPLVAIARNTRGDATQREVQITIQ